MGSLHEGHLTLIQYAKTLNIPTVATIYVNQLQFNDSQDFDRYPREIAKDTSLLQQLSHPPDILFTPSSQDLFNQQLPITIDLPSKYYKLEGKHRPHYFSGVAITLLKLIHISKATDIVLGKKDYQQMLMVKELLASLDIDCQTHSIETKRDKDGLALSSRNKLLTKEQRDRAPLLYQCLQITATQHNTQQAQQTLQDNNFQIDYLQIYSTDLTQQYDTNQQLTSGQYICLVAAHLGSVRLIDNIEFTVP